MTEGEFLRQDFARDIPQSGVDELLRLQLDYPYFQAARFLYLKKLQHSFPERYTAALHENIIYAGNRKSLFFCLEGAQQSWSNLYPEKVADEETADTFDLIDSYLASHTGSLPAQEELPLIEAAYNLEAALAESQPETVTETAAEGAFGLIDAFLEKSPEEKTPVPLPLPTDATHPDIDGKNEEELQDEEFLTESLAKIYIKQRRYAKALEIIRRLSLKYPEKNIYFADQIRFLEKLIINIKTK